MPLVKHYSSNEVNQQELMSRLLTLMENNTSYTLSQINGQRVFKKSPHAWSGPEPLRTCEVFIGRIPHDCFEDMLVPLFQQAGELYEFRLMINFSGWNRGYAFAMYLREADALNAIRMFNNYMIRPSWQLGVCHSINNCRIFISRIPQTTPTEEIVRLMYALTDEVAEVRIRRSVAACAAIVEYKSHRGAAMARKALVAAAAAAWGSCVRPTVDWSLPQSAQLLRQYREVGRWTPERGIEVVRIPEDVGTAPLPSVTTSFVLEPWSQERRLRMIHAAQRNAAAAAAAAATAAPATAATAKETAYQWSTYNNDVESIAPSMASWNYSPGLGMNEAAVWAPPTYQTNFTAPSIPPTPVRSMTSSASMTSNSMMEAPEFNPWTALPSFREFMTYSKDNQ